MTPAEYNQLQANLKSHSKHVDSANDKSDTPSVCVRPRASTAVKDSLTLQKENSALCMLLAGHCGTETGDNTAVVTWGRDEYEVIINLKK